MYVCSGLVYLSLMQCKSVVRRKNRRIFFVWCAPDEQSVTLAKPFRSDVDLVNKQTASHSFGSVDSISLSISRSRKSNGWCSYFDTQDATCEHARVFRSSSTSLWSGGLAVLDATVPVLFRSLHNA